MGEKLTINSLLCSISDWLSLVKKLLAVWNTLKIPFVLLVRSCILYPERTFVIINERYSNLEYGNYTRFRRVNCNIVKTWSVIEKWLTRIWIHQRSKTNWSRLNKTRFDSVFIWEIWRARREGHDNSSIIQVEVREIDGTAESITADGSSVCVYDNIYIAIFTF